MSRDGGRLVVVGQYTDADEATFRPHADLKRKHLDVRGVWGFDYSHLHRAVEILACHGEAVGWERTISRRYALAEADEALGGRRGGPGGEGSDRAGAGGGAGQLGAFAGPVALMRPPGCRSRETPWSTEEVAAYDSRWIGEAAVARMTIYRPAYAERQLVRGGR
ncbi:MAG TPA: hypothetical protein VML55_09135 [Planctomycetaceae bacterium]|nr:hypothetical protein [Planctomycetaceae bacterium]